MWLVRFLMHRTLHKAFFSDNRFLDSLHKSFLNQTTLDLRKEKWTFLNREFTVIHFFGTRKLFSEVKRKKKISSPPKKTKQDPYRYQ